MITRKILSKPVGRILAIVLVLVCCWYIIIDAKAAVTIGRGYVEVNIVGGEAREQILLNGETPRSGRTLLHSERAALSGSAKRNRSGSARGGAYDAPYENPANSGVPDTDMHSAYKHSQKAYLYISKRETAAGRGNNHRCGGRACAGNQWQGHSGNSKRGVG